MDSVEYKCPNCNADLKFDPVSQKLSCEFCDSSFTVEEIKQICAAAENSIPPETAAAQEEFSEHTNLYHCKSCGAEIMADDQQTATFCYYCHNPVILSGKMSGSYKPSKIIGFRLTRENAENAFKKWIKSRKFVPTDFKSQQQIGFGRILANGEHFTLSPVGIIVEAVPAYNTTAGREQFHPKGNGNGYLIHFWGTLSAYVAGDTEDIPEMVDIPKMRQNMRISVAFLPVNQPYTMTVDQCVNAARMVNPEVLIPYHFSQTDLSGLADRLPEMKVLLHDMQ